MDHLLHFGVSLKGRGLAVSSIHGRFAALVFASKMLGFSEISGDFRIRKKLEGWTHEEASRNDP